MQLLVSAKSHFEPRIQRHPATGFTPSRLVSGTAGVESYGTVLLLSVAKMGNAQLQVQQVHSSPVIDRRGSNWKGRVTPISSNSSATHRGKGWLEGAEESPWRGFDGRGGRGKVIRLRW